MPTLNISSVASTLLGGLAVIMAVLWLLIHLTAVRELRKSSPGGLH